MTYDTINQIYVTDIDASELAFPPGRWPLVVSHENRAWLLDEPKFSPSGDLEAYHYVPKDDVDFPCVLCVWND